MLAAETGSAPTPMSQGQLLLVSRDLAKVAKRVRSQGDMLDKSKALLVLAEELSRVDDKNYNIAIGLQALITAAVGMAKATGKAAAPIFSEVAKGLEAQEAKEPKPLPTAAS